MDRIRAGEARAFEVVFDRHVGAAFSLAYRMCGSQAAAEDVVQESFLALWRSGTTYERARGSVRSWILSVVRNRAIDVLRRDMTRHRRELRNEPDAPADDWLLSPHRTDTEVERRDDAHRVRCALDELPSDQRRVIELAYFGGFTHTQIAEMLELPEGTVKGRMRLGLSKLRLSLDSGGLVP